MSAMPIFIVFVLWSVYIGMGLVARRERRSMNSIATFNRHLAVLARTAPGPDIDPVSGRTAPHHARRATGMNLVEARRRRRHVLTALAGVASVTAALAFVGGGLFVALHLLADAALAAYLVLLARNQHAAVERRAKVVYLPARPVVSRVEPAYLQRSAN
jgi:DNA-binding transcriptional ArsR family regulator